MSKTALIVGGAGATGQHIVRGLAARGYDVTVLHRGVHEPAYLLPYRHLHADPHFAEPVLQVLGRENFDVVVLTYGRIEQLAKVFAGRCARLVSVGGIPVYPGFVEAAAQLPAGVPLLVTEEQAPGDLTRIQDDKARAFVAKMSAAERAVLDQHDKGAYRASVFRYPRIYGANSIVSQEWSLVRRIIDRRPFVLLPNAGATTFSRCAAINAAHTLLLSLECEAAGGQVFNCGDDDQFSLAQWAEIVLDALGAQVELVGLPTTLNHVAPHFALYGGSMFGHALTSTAKARALLAYRDVIPAVNAIAESARWWFNEGAAVAAGNIARDTFDYGLEDRLYQRLAGLAADFPSAARSAPFHSYPHPKTPTTSKDHYGR